MREDGCLQGVDLSHPNFRLLWVTGPHLPQCLLPLIPHTLVLGGFGAPHLEMEDAGIAILEALAVWYHSMQKRVTEGEGGNGSQEPTIPWDGRDPH